jgi:hypothetical protein
MNWKKYFLLNLFLLWIVLPACAGIVQIKKPIFDTTKYLNKSKSNEAFFPPMTILYENKLLPHGSDFIDTEYLRGLALSLPKSSIPYILDIESWKCGKDVDDLTASTSIDKYILVIDTMKKVRPDLKFGYFGIIPVKAPIVETMLSERSMQEWKYALARMDRLILHVDIICPEGYTYFNNQEAWTRYMNLIIKEAKTYGKPIYPFLWPEFMSSTPLKGKFIPSDFWRYQLDFVYKKCDGVIIWGGRDFTVSPTVSREWNESAAWWIETKNFILLNSLR